MSLYDELLAQAKKPVVALPKPAYVPTEEDRIRVPTPEEAAAMVRGLSGQPAPAPESSSFLKEAGKSALRAAISLPKMVTDAAAGASNLVGSALMGVKPEDNIVSKPLQYMSDYYGWAQTGVDRAQDPRMYENGTLKPESVLAEDQEYSVAHPVVSTVGRIVEGAVPYLVGGAAKAGMKALPAVAGLEHFNENINEAVRKRPEESARQAAGRALPGAALTGGMFAAMGPASKLVEGVLPSVLKGSTNLAERGTVDLLKDITAKGLFDAHYLQAQGTAGKAMDKATGILDENTSLMPTLEEYGTNLLTGMGFGAYGHAPAHFKQRGARAQARGEAKQEREDAELLLSTYKTSPSEYATASERANKHILEQAQGVADLIVSKQPDPEQRTTQENALLEHVQNNQGNVASLAKGLGWSYNNVLADILRVDKEARTKIKEAEKNVVDLNEADGTQGTPVSTPSAIATGKPQEITTTTKGTPALERKMPVEAVEEDLPWTEVDGEIEEPPTPVAKVPKSKKVEPVIDEEAPWPPEDEPVFDTTPSVVKPKAIAPKPKEVVPEPEVSETDPSAFEETVSNRVLLPHELTTAESKNYILGRKAPTKSGKVRTKEETEAALRHAKDTNEIYAEAFDTKEGTDGFVEVKAKDNRTHAQLRETSHGVVAINLPFADKVTQKVINKLYRLVNKYGKDGLVVRIAKDKATWEATDKPIQIYVPKGYDKRGQHDTLTDTIHNSRKEIKKGELAGNTIGRQDSKSASILSQIAHALGGRTGNKIEIKKGSKASYPFKVVDKASGKKTARENVLFVRNPKSEGYKNSRLGATRKATPETVKPKTKPVVEAKKPSVEKTTKLIEELEAAKKKDEAFVEIVREYATDEDAHIDTAVLDFLKAQDFPVTDKASVKKAYENAVERLEGFEARIEDAKAALEEAKTAPKEAPKKTVVEKDADIKAENDKLKNDLREIAHTMTRSQFILEWNALPLRQESGPHKGELYGKPSTPKAIAAAKSFQKNTLPKMHYALYHEALKAGKTGIHNENKTKYGAATLGGPRNNKTIAIDPEAAKADYLKRQERNKKDEEDFPNMDEDPFGSQEADIFDTLASMGVDSKEAEAMVVKAAFGKKKEATSAPVEEAKEAPVVAGERKGNVIRRAGKTKPSEASLEDLKNSKTSKLSINEEKKENDVPESGVVASPLVRKFFDGTESVGSSPGVPDNIQKFVRALSGKFNLDKWIYVANLSDISSRDREWGGSFRELYDNKGKNLGMIIPHDVGYILALNPTALKVNGYDALRIVAHEVGHAIIHQHYHEASLKTQLAIEKDFQNWMARHRKGDQTAVNEYFHNTTKTSADLQKSIDGYHKRGQSIFDEYLAQQISKYIMFEKPTRGIVATFFKNIANRIKELYAQYTNANPEGLAKESVKEFLSEVMAKRVKIETPKVEKPKDFPEDRVTTEVVTNAVQNAATQKLKAQYKETVAKVTEQENITSKIEQDTIVKYPEEYKKAKEQYGASLATTDYFVMSTLGKFDLSLMNKYSKALKLITMYEGHLQEIDRKLNKVDPIVQYSDMRLTGPVDESFNLLVNGSDKYMDQYKKAPLTKEEQERRQKEYGDYPVNNAHRPVYESTVPEGHFGQGNFIHVRGNVRKDVDGKPLMVINEHQSDWNKTYTKHVKNSLSDKERVALEKKQTEIATVYKETRAKLNTYIEDNFKPLGTTGTTEDLRKMFKHLSSQKDASLLHRIKLQKKETSTLSPVELEKELRTRFKLVEDNSLRYTENISKLDAVKNKIAPPPIENFWREHAVKQTLRYAMERGLDRVAYPSTPEQVAEVEMWGTLETKVNPETGKMEYFTHGQNVTNIVNGMIEKTPAFLAKLAKEHGFKVGQVEVPKKEKVEEVLSKHPYVKAVKQGVEENNHTLNYIEFKNPIAKEWIKSKGAQYFVEDALTEVEGTPVVDTKKGVKSLTKDVVTKTEKIAKNVIEQTGLMNILKSSVKDIAKVLFPQYRADKTSLYYAYALKALPKQMADEVDVKLHSYRKEFNKMSTEDRLAFLDKLRSGRLDELTPSQREFASKCADISDSVFTQLRELFPTLEKKDNHFGMSLVWRVLGQAEGETDAFRTVFGSRLEGTKSYSKKRSDRAISEIYKQGKMEPKFTDPIDIIKGYVHDAYKLISINRTLQQMQLNDVAKWVASNEKKPKDMATLDDRAAKAFSPVLATGKWKIKMEDGSFYKTRSGNEKIFPTEYAANSFMKGKGVVGEVEGKNDERFKLSGYDIKIGDGDSKEVVKTLKDRATAEKYAEEHFAEEMEEGNVFITPNLIKAGPSESGELYFPKDFANMINNHLSRDLVRENALTNTARKIKSHYTAAELALSAFHWATITNEHAASVLGHIVSTTVNAALRGKLTDANYKSHMRNAIESIWNSKGINKLLEQYVADPEGTMKDPKNVAEMKRRFGSVTLKEIVDAYYHAGGMLRSDASLKANEASRWHHTGIKDVIDTVKVEWKERGKTVTGNAKFLVDTSWSALTSVPQNYLFEKIIPAVKLAHFASEYAFAIEMNRSNKPELQKSWDEIARDTHAFVEARFGETNWDNLWLNRTSKSIAQTFFRSATWKLGTIQAFYGGFKGAAKLPVNIIKKIKNGEPIELDHKMTWMISLLTLNAAAAAIIQTAITGETPEDMKDLMFPRASKRDPDYRVALPSYTKDLYAIIKSAKADPYFVPVTYFEHGVSGLWARTADVYHNRDFFNTKIRNPEENYAKQSFDVMMHLLPLPISITNVQKDIKTGESKFKSALYNVAGLNKAPAYVSQSDAEREAFKKSKEFAPQYAKTREEKDHVDEVTKIARDIQTGDFETYKEALRNGQLSKSDKRNIKDKISLKGINRIVRRLNIEDALKVYSLGDTSEKLQMRAIVLAKYKNALKNAAPAEVKELREKAEKALRII